MINERSAGCVLFNEKTHKFLLLQHTARHWDFPKGNIERGEKEVDTVVRETEEETGIAYINFIEGFRESIKYFYRRGGQLVNKEVVFFLAKTDIEKVTISHEHTGFEWVDYDVAIKKITYENSREVLKKAHAFMKKKLFFE